MLLVAEVTVRLTALPKSIGVVDGTKTSLVVTLQLRLTLLAIARGDTKLSKLNHHAATFLLDSIVEKLTITMTSTLLDVARRVVEILRPTVFGVFAGHGRLAIEW